MQFYYKGGLARADLGRVEDAIADIEKAIAAENDVLSDLTNRMRQALVLQYRQAADAKLTRGEALRQAMMVLLDGKGFEVQGKTLFTYGHPLFWPPYTIIGDGGSSANQ